MYFYLVDPYQVSGIASDTVVNDGPIASKKIPANYNELGNFPEEIFH